MKKVGLLCMALVLALGALGVGFAAWMDTIDIVGEVYTGSVDINIVDTSNTLVYKCPASVSEDELFILHYWDSDVQSAPYDLIAWADTDSILGSPAYFPGAGGVPPGDDEIYVWYHNVFPSINFDCDFLLHYDGSIPAKVNALSLTYDPVVGGDLTNYITVMCYESDAAGTMGAPVDLLGLQLHECDYILVVIRLHLPQDDDTLQGCEGALTGKISVIQWNEA